MFALQKNGLWGNGLIVIDVPELVNRYNECLDDMGIQQTALNQFCIDAMGWSPEIAHEKNNVYYLSHGDANQMAIVLMPAQQNHPIYAPFHSFDLDLMSQWYEAHKAQIVELTKTTGIWLHINQKMDQYHDPDDVLLIDNIVVETYTPSQLIVKADLQKKLVRQFMESPRDSSQMSQMLTVVPHLLKESVAEVGSVAYRQMVIENMPYSMPCSFYSRAFGGIFVLRSANCEMESIISRDDAMRDIGVRSSMDKKILRALEDFGLISYETERWTDRLYRLKIIRDSFLIDVLDVCEPNVDFTKLSSVKKNELLNRPEIKRKLPAEYAQLDHIIMQIQKGILPQKLPAKVRPYLAHPLRMLDKSVQEVVWYILSLVCDGRSIVRLYRYDKDVFIQKYNSWPMSHRSWAIDCIQKYHVQKRSS